MTDHRIAEQIAEKRRVLRSHLDDRRISASSRSSRSRARRTRFGRVPFVDQIRLRRWIDRMPPHMTENCLSVGSPDEIQTLLSSSGAPLPIASTAASDGATALLLPALRRARWVERFRGGDRPVTLVTTMPRHPL